MVNISVSYFENKRQCLPFSPVISAKLHVALGDGFSPRQQTPLCRIEPLIADRHQQSRRLMLPYRATAIKL